MKLITSFYESLNVTSAEFIGNTLQPTASAHAAQLALGPCFIGWLLGLFTVGILSCLFFSYVTSPLYVQDPILIRCCVWMVWATALMSAAMNVIEAYSYGAMCALVVQLYLARRSTSLLETRSRRNIIRALLYLIVIGSWTFSVVQVILTFYSRMGGEKTMEKLTLNLASAIWLWSTAIAEISVTTVLCLSLRSKLSQTQDHLTDIVLQKLIKLAIHSALITCLVAVGGATSATLAIDPESPLINLDIAFISLLPGLYGIVFIVTLMIRQQLRVELEGGPSAHPEMMATTHINDLPSFVLACHPSPSIKQSSPHPTSSPFWSNRLSSSNHNKFFNLNPTFFSWHIKHPTNPAVRQDGSLDQPRRFQRLGSLF